MKLLKKLISILIILCFIIGLISGVIAIYFRFTKGRGEKLLEEINQKNIPTFVSSETEALFSQAIEYHRDGKLSKARAEAKKVINSYPENKEVLIYGYRLLNWISFDEQKFDQCIKEGELCLKNYLNPKFHPPI